VVSTREELPILEVGGDVPGESPTPTLSVPAAVAPDVIFLLGDTCRGASSTPLIILALREKSQAPDSRAGDGGD
jgi:hypothetical protein